jgi:hypothetical protein
MGFRGKIAVCALALGMGVMTGGVADAATGPRAEVRAVYRSVLLAEYFGPASAVCSRLTARGVKSFTAGGQGTCTHAFDEQRSVLRHKTRGVDDSGFTPRSWRTVVAQVMAQLRLSVHGAHATAIGPSGIPGQTSLVKVNGRWLFNSYPPSIQS